MSPRPRKASDDEVFGAATRVMSRVGPADLTLAAIAAEAGLTAGALVQRFGSKRQLMLAMTARLSDTTADMVAGLRAKHRTPLATLRAYAECFADMASSPAALARSFAYLQIDLTDPDLYPHLLAQARATRAAFEALVQEAISAGDLKADADPVLLARAIEVTLGGSLMSWAVHREGRAAAWLRQDLEAVFRPYRKAEPAQGGSARRSRRRRSSADRRL